MRQDDTPTVLLPPGPERDFDVALSAGALEALQADFAHYGAIHKYRSPGGQHYTYALHHPDYVRHVLASNSRNYTKGVGIERVKLLLGNGLIVSEGEFWKSQRQLIQPAFHQRVLHRFATLMGQCHVALLSRWETALQQRQAIDLTKDMSEVALHCILAVLFSDDLERLISSRGENPFALVHTESARDLQFARRFRALTGLVAEIIASRRRDAHQAYDLLALLMAARDKQTGAAMPDRQLIDEVMTLIIAGHETTASTLNWAWYLLAQHPACEAQLHAELDAQLQGRAPTLADLVRLPYLRQVIDETLRLYPPVWILTRRAINADVIAGYTVPPRTDMVISPYILHRHAAFWEAPEAFRPERFADSAKKTRHPFAYIPFSAGPRTCIGDALARSEMQLHIATLAQHLRLIMVSGAPVVLEPKINLRPKHSIFMLPVQR
jgi:cytochrome P450